MTHMADFYRVKLISRLYRNGLLHRVRNCHDINKVDTCVIQQKSSLDRRLENDSRWRFKPRLLARINDMDK